MLKVPSGAFICLVALAISCFPVTVSAQGVIINLDATKNSRVRPIVRSFTAGKYFVQPIGIADGGAYDAYEASTSGPGTWVTDYSIASSQFPTIRCWDHHGYMTASGALENAVSAEFTLQRDGNVQFYVTDDALGDNRGGVSLNVREIEKTIHVDHSATGTNDGSSWENAFTNLSDALVVALEGDEVWVAAGIYTPGTTRTDSFAVGPGVAVYGGFAGTETQRNERNPAGTLTVLTGDLNGDDYPTRALGNPLRGNDENCYHVVTLEADSTIDGFTVTGGKADGLQEGESLGAGLSLVGNAVTARNLIIHMNAAMEGGGIHVVPNVTAVLSNCLICENGAITGGGAFFANGSAPRVVNSTCAGNQALQGAGIFCEENAAPILTNCIVWNGMDESLVVTEGAAPDVSYTCIESGVVWGGEGTIAENPLFREIGHVDDPGTPDDPSDDGWITGRYDLLYGSVAVDAGLVTAAPEFDIAGNARPCGDAVDMGAYEYCPEGDFYIRLPEETDAALRGLATVAVMLDFDHNAETPEPDPIQGWSYGVCHDPQILQPRTVTFEGTDTATLHGGNGPDFIAVQLPKDLASGLDNGVTIAVVIDTVAPLETLAPQNGWRVQ